MYIYFKRILDISFSLLLLLFLSPLLIAIGLVIKLDSPGPIIFTQMRIGKDLMPFKIYKFRTMQTDSPKNIPTRDFKDVHQHITRFGSYLRKTSLDELPQLINILQGDMAFVGPRPVVPVEIELINARQRYKAYEVLPGVTGWAQINGRDLVSLEEKAALDGLYAQHNNMWIDLKIIFMTFIVVVKRKGFFEGNTETEETTSPFLNESETKSEN